MPFRNFRRPVPTPVERALCRAQRLIGFGRYDQAGQLLAGLAAELDAAGRPRAAAEMHARAAHCYVEGGIAAAALVEARTALERFREAGMPARFERFHANIYRKMLARGMQFGSESLRSQFGLPAPDAAQPPAPPSAARLVLPTACEKCGAPVRSDEVDWIDSASAECAYCGAVLQAVPQR